MNKKKIIQKLKFKTIQQYANTELATVKFSPSKSVARTKVPVCSLVRISKRVLFFQKKGRHRKSLPGRRSIGYAS